MNKHTYYFPPLGGGEETGFHDPLIYHFSGEILYHLTRESIQNIVDARDPKAEGPVIAEFKLSRIGAQSIPDANGLIDILGACWRHEKSDKGEGEIFFKNAYDLMNDKKMINVLAINDYNTTGLFGRDDEREGAYYKLMKISGSSNKGAGMGGTYGIGKGAYFRPSLFRTIFVSSIWGDNQAVFQGKLRLVSHEPPNGEFKHGVGFYASPAIRNVSDIPEMFKRTEKGTSIFIIGFEEIYNWRKKMLESVLRYFWLAILEGELKVRIENTIVNQENVEEIIMEYFGNEKVFDKDNPIPYYKAYKEGKVIHSKLPTLGHVELRIFLQKDFHRRIEYFRNTRMVIQNKKHQSGKGFAGVFICNDREGLLRKMEDPTHSRWSKDFAITNDPQGKQRYTSAEEELENFIDESLTELTASVESTTSTIKDLDKYFYSPADDNDPDKSGSPESIESQIVQEETGSIIRGENIMGKQPKINVQVTIPTYTAGELGGNEGQGGGRGGKRIPVHPEDKGSKIIKVNRNIKFRRSYAERNETYPRHTVFIAGDKGDKFNLEVRVGTEDSFDTVNIKAATDEKGKNFDIDRNFIKNIMIPDEGELKVKILFDEPGKYSLNLRAYEN